MPLKVIIVGAGIAGLCAAVALSQAGHLVEIFEKSKFATEIGAAVSLGPNGIHVLRSFGFSFQRARARQLMIWESVDGITLKQFSALDMEHAQEEYGAPFMSIHRVDLHKELLRLALNDDEGKEKGAMLRLGSPVVGVNVEDGIIELEDSSKHQADLIVAADGLHSILRSAVLKREAKPIPSGLSAFRFLIPTKTLEEDPAMTNLLKWKVPLSATVLADTTDTLKERHAVWYECQGGEVQNFVGIHPTQEALNGTPSSNSAEVKDSMVQEFSHFHPDIVKVFRSAEDVKRWPLYIYDPMPSWEFGKVLLIGDSAHPMLPFGGQGANQAMEDGGALGYLLQGVEDATAIPARLAIFDRVRRNRASRIQTLSKVRAGREKEVEQELKKYIENGYSAIPVTFPERIAHDFGFNVFGRCEEMLRQA